MTKQAERVRPSEAAPSEFLTWAQTAARVNKTPRWVKRRVYQFGEFESALVGNERMILRSSVEAYIARKTAESTP